MSYGLGETVSEAHTRLIRQLHEIASAIYMAKQAGDVQRVVTLRAQFQDVAAEYRALGGSGLSTFDNFLLGLDKWIRESLAALPGAISAVPSGIFAGTLKAMLPWVLGYAAFVYLMRKV